MGEHEPGLFDHDERGPAREALLDPVEEVGEHGGGVDVALVHEVLHLEDLEAALAQPVLLGIEEPPHGALERVVAQAVADLAILDGVEEVGERAALAGTEPLERHVHRLPMGRRHGHALEPEQRLDPAGGLGEDQARPGSR